MGKDSGDKLPLKTEVINYNRLKDRVEQWLENTGVGGIRSRHHFRTLPDFISSTQPSILASIILYAIQKRMPSLIRDEEES